MNRPPRAGMGLTALLVAVTGCAPLTGHTSEAGTGPAGDLLAQLVVEPEDTSAPYRRSEWGEGWDNHGRGCDTREIVLFAQGRGVQQGQGCRPVCPPGPACWTSPYDGVATGSASDLEIDHRVPVAEAARSRVIGTGRSATRVWSPEQKHAFYEDQANLIAITDNLNSGRGDDDPGTWSPPSEAAWCEFATGYINTKIAHRLTVDQAEYNGLARMLATCDRRTP
jgi:hypothetical protein